MKKILLLFAVLVISLSAQAQDVVITKEGDALKVYGLEVSSTAVFYRESQDVNAPIVRKSKSDLLMIKYSDGRKEIMGEDNNASQPAVSQQTATDAPVEFTAEDNAANEAALAKWKSFPASKLKATKKRASMLCCILRPDKDSRIADKNVELTFHGANTLLSWTNDVNFVLGVKNKTNKTIYLDLGNSFFIRGEQSEAYYVPTANSSTSGTNSGASVNLGALTGAMGIGGAVGKVASGINVGKGSSKHNTTVVYSQRVVAIPPMSTKKLEGMELKRGNPKMADATETGVPYQLNAGTIINLGAAVDFEEGQLPVKFGSFVTYSFTEDIQSPRILQAKLSIRRILGIPEGKDLGMGTGLANGKELTPEQQNDVICITKQAKE